MAISPKATAMTTSLSMREWRNRIESPRGRVNRPTGTVCRILHRGTGRLPSASDAGLVAAGPAPGGVTCESRGDHLDGGEQSAYPRSKASLPPSGPTAIRIGLSADLSARRSRPADCSNVMTADDREAMADRPLATRGG